MASQVLVVDDQPNVRATVAYLLQEEGYEVSRAASGEEALALLESRDFEFALIDLKMARMDGLELLRRIRARWPSVAVILMTAYASIPSAVDAMKLGAAHYLEKPFTKENLLEAFARTRSDYRGPADNDSSGTFQDLARSSPSLKRVLERAARHAADDKPVLIVGEFGTGKETLARALHAASPRASAPFLPFRCSGIEAEDVALFEPDGGAAARAEGGFLYVEGVEQLGAEHQGRLVRLIRDGRLQAATTERRIDVRVVAAAAEELEPRVAKGSFRRDLFLLLRTVTLHLPPLRERTRDLPHLVRAFLRRHASRPAAVRFEKDAFVLLGHLPFPGNLEELSNLVEEAVAAAGGGPVTAATLAELGVEAAPEAEERSGGIRSRIELEEKRAIEEELKRNPRNLKQTAKNLNISRTTLWRKMKKYGLHAR